MVGRSRDGSTMAFPVVETLHQNSILLVTEAPAQVLPGTQRRAQQVAQQAVACLDGAQHGGNERDDICRTHPTWLFPFQAAAVLAPVLFAVRGAIQAASFTLEHAPHACICQLRHGKAYSSGTPGCVFWFQ